MQTKLEMNEYCFVFDLDDTLYKEWEYRKSGIKFVIKKLESIYGEKNSKIICYDSVASFDDPMEEICRAFALPKNAKESLIWLYRLHSPSIVLADGVQDFFCHMQNVSKKCILTDGRSVTQRLKLNALGLSHVPMFVSEELGFTKEEEGGVIAIERLFGAKNYVYVGDNPRKDFLIPNQRNWLTFGVKGDDRNIHDQVCSDLSHAFFPRHWIKSFTDLRGFFC